jgi:hypothetical protein
VPGQPVKLTLWWSAEGPLDNDYTVFAHLIDKQGDMISQADSRPKDGRYPTDFWGQELVLDEHSFVLPPGSPAGPTQVQLGFYRVLDGIRLPRSADAELPDAVLIPGPTIVK